MIQRRDAFRILLLLACTALAAQDSKPLPPPSSAGKNINNATHAAADDLAHGRPKDGAVEVLSATQGVDFRAYVQKLSTAVRNTWYLSLPQEARIRTGTLTIEFEVSPDGRLSTMKLVTSSDDALLDRLAWRAIRGSAPFPALPTAFTGGNLKLRYRFYYNGIP